MGRRDSGSDVSLLCDKKIPGKFPKIMAVSERQKKWQDTASYVAAGELTDLEIASRVGIDPKTIYNWRRNPRFVKRVEACREAIRFSLVGRKISMKEARVARLNKDWLALQKLIEERGAD